MGRNIVTKTFKCESCGNVWRPALWLLPKTCPKCRSPYWDTPGKEKKRNDMIKTKCVYAPVEDSDGFRVLIMRKWPQGIGYRKNNKRGMIDKRCKELGPSKEL